MGVEIESAAPVQLAGKVDVAGHSLDFRSLEQSTTDAHSSTHRRKRGIGAASAECHGPRCALRSDPARRSSDVDIAIDCFRVQLFRITCNIDRAAYYIEIQL